MTPAQQESHAAPAIGIDLGTTYSAVACLDDHGKPFTIQNQDGDLLTPTAVLIDQQQIVVGREAINAAALEPDSYADCFKRDVGAPVFRRGLSGIQVPPQVLSAFVLDALKRDAQQRLGPVKQAVITVPAFFDEARRKATEDAGRLAGLEVLDIINEPTAAALAYGHQIGLIRPRSGDSRVAGQQARVLVYDLGGGTFDVTILEVDGTTYRAVATDGDVQLGGKDFDERIVEYLAERFIQDHGIDPRSDPRDAAQIWADAQRVKHSLTQRSKAATVLFYGGLRSSVELTRDDFERLTCDLLERTETTTSLVVREAGLTWHQIDRVLLVGGSSRMPAVTQMLSRVTGKEVDRSLSPDEAVAHGAALHAAMLTQSNEQLASCQLINVNSHSLGVRGIDNQTRRKVNAIMIPKNTPLPCKQAREFTTVQDDQRSVKVVVLEGESHRPEDCIELGDCVIRDLPPGLPKGSKIEVTYRYDTKGRVSVSARMPRTRQSARVEIQRSNSVEWEDLETWRNRLMGAGGERASNLQDAGSVLRQLDELYAKIGHVVVRSTVPQPIQRSQAAAQKAMAAYRAAASAHKQSETARAACQDRMELMQGSAKHAKSKAKLEQTRAQAEFACIVLGRECVKHGYAPKNVAESASKAKRLREQHLE